MKKEAFYFPMKIRERILGFVILPLHIFAIPSLVVLIFSHVTLLGMTDTKLNVISYLISFLFLLLFLSGSMKAMLDTLLQNIRRAAVSTALCYLVYVSLLIIVSIVISGNMESLSNPNEDALALLIAEDKKSFILLSLLLAPIVEEILFRGVIFGTVRTKSSLLAYLISYLMFALYHIYPYFLKAYSPELFWNLLQYLPASIALAVCYEKSESICSSIALHIVINAVTLSTYIF